MQSSSEILSVLSQLFWLIPTILILVGTIILYGKTKSGIVILLIVAQSLQFIAGLFNVLIFSFLLNNMDNPSNFQNISYVRAGLSTLASLLFGIGLIIFASNYFKGNTNLKD